MTARRMARSASAHGARCACPACRALDSAFPHDGFQLVLPLSGGAPVPVQALLAGGG